MLSGRLAGLGLNEVLDLPANLLIDEIGRRFALTRPYSAQQWERLRAQRLPKTLPRADTLDTRPSSVGNCSRGALLA